MQREAKVDFASVLAADQEVALRKAEGFGGNALPDRSSSNDEDHKFLLQGVVGRGDCPRRRKRWGKEGESSPPKWRGQPAFFRRWPAQSDRTTSPASNSENRRGRPTRPASSDRYPRHRQRIADGRGRDANAAAANQQPARQQRQREDRTRGGGVARPRFMEAYSLWPIGRSVETQAADMHREATGMKISGRRSPGSASDAAAN